ncbi:MAG: hypothetical protein ACI4F9_07710 [Lachnospiraceae bacterium]
MIYCIEFKKGYPKKVDGREELLKLLKENDKEIIDIRKEHKNGFSETVLEKYEKYIKK